MADIKLIFDVRCCLIQLGTQPGEYIAVAQDEVNGHGQGIGRRHATNHHCGSLVNGHIGWGNHVVALRLGGQEIVEKG
jgi:hypothetical protein